MKIEEQLTYLKMQLDLLCDLVPKGHPVVLIHYAVSMNGGDLLLWLATEKFLSDQGYEIAGRYSFYERIGSIGRTLPDGTTLIFMGGGYIGDIYPKNHRWCLDIMQRYSAYRIVMFPQSVCFRIESNLSQSLAIFSSLPNFHFVARDGRSYELLSACSNFSVYLLPDIVHYFWQDEGGPFALKQSKDREARLYLIRRDAEAAPAPEGLDFPLPTQDWPDLFGQRYRAEFWSIMLWYKFVQFLSVPPMPKVYWQRLGERMSFRAIEELAGNRIIVTNRLHGVLAGLLLNKEIVAIENAIGKLGNYIETWLPDCRSIKYLK